MKGVNGANSYDVSLFVSRLSRTMGKTTQAGMREAYMSLELREQTRAQLARSGDKRYSIARSLRHHEDNRYMDILAYDRTAVSLANGGYLNANIVSDGAKWWVAAQAPVPHTLPTFWQAIYERAASAHPLVRAHTRPANRAILVQLTGWEEKGRPKAHNYMSTGTLGNLQISIGQGKERPDLGSVQTEIKLNGDFTVEHYYFGAWPDHGVPQGKSVDQLRNLVLEIERVRGDAEVWVHW